MSELELTVETIGSPVGDLLVVCRDGIICALEFADHAARMHKLLGKRFKAYRRLIEKILKVCTRQKKES